MTRFTLLACFSLFAAACSSTIEPEPSATPEATAVAPSSTTGPVCDDETLEALAGWEASGFDGSVAFTTSGNVDCAAGFGDADRSDERPIDAETVFSIGSITKAFTAAAVLRLADAGLLTLEDTAATWLPELTGPLREVTLRQLLTHSSGLTGSIGRDHEPLAADDAIAAAAELEIAFDPGAESLYSNAGFSLLALVVDAATEDGYRRYLSDEILTVDDRPIGGFWDGEPAAPGARAVGYLDDGSRGADGGFGGPHWALDGNGGLAMSAIDLARWVNALQNGEILTPTALETMTAAAFDLGDGRGEAMGWVTLDESVLGVAGLATSGGGGAIGHQATVVWLPEAEQTFVVMSNTPEVTAESLLQSLLPALIAGDRLPVPDAVTQPNPAEADALAGRYLVSPTGGDGSDEPAFEVTSEDGWLQVAAAGSEALTHLFPRPDFVDEAAVADHEARVLDLLNGETEEGRLEIERLEADFGKLQEVAIDATIFADFELRTYVRVTLESETVPAWLAIDEQGGLAAAELFPPPAALRLGLTADASTYRPLDLDGTDPDIEVTFDGDTMVVTGPAGPLEARRLP